MGGPIHRPFRWSHVVAARQAALIDRELASGPKAGGISLASVIA
jgi:hypothetical protein